MGAVWRGNKKAAPESGSCGVANMSPHLVWLNLLPQIYTQVRNLSTHVVGDPQKERAQAPALHTIGWTLPAPRPFAGATAKER